MIVLDLGIMNINSDDVIFKAVSDRSVNTALIKSVFQLADIEKLN